jgi:hypothetical protein
VFFKRIYWNFAESSDKKWQIQSMQYRCDYFNANANTEDQSLEVFQSYFLLTVEVYRGGRREQIKDL